MKNVIEAMQTMQVGKVIYIMALDVRHILIVSKINKNECKKSSFYCNRNAILTVFKTGLTTNTVVRTYLKSFKT